MTAKVFVDTNVLVYSRDASEPYKQKKALAWMAHLWSTKTGILSYQVLHGISVLKISQYHRLRCQPQGAQGADGYGGRM